MGGFTAWRCRSAQMRFMMCRGAMNTPLLIRFMGRLIRDAKRKVFLILDNLSAHHSKLVKRWLDRHREEIEVFFLTVAYAA